MITGLPAERQIAFENQLMISSYRASSELPIATHDKGRVA
jgi:hypothetical protein